MKTLLIADIYNYFFTIKYIYIYESILIYLLIYLFKIPEMYLSHNWPIRVNILKFFFFFFFFFFYKSNIYLYIYNLIINKYYFCTINIF